MSREDDLKHLSEALFRSPSDLLMGQEVARIVLKSAKSASATFMGEMAKPWPDPEVILDRLWDEQALSLEDDVIEAMAKSLNDDDGDVDWGQLEAAWRKEIQRIYATWGSG